MSEGTFYNWKAKFGGMTVSGAKRLKTLEDENAKLQVQANVAPVGPRKPAGRWPSSCWIWLR